MSLLLPPRRFDPALPEMMDRPGHDPAVLRADLELLEKINRHLGGHHIALHYLRRLCQNRVTPVTHFWHNALSVLDLGTGAADVPRAIVQWARARRLPIQITAVDGNPEILRIARQLCAHYPEIRFEQHDLRALPYPPGSFDVVLCSLTLHHFSDTDAVEILRRIRQIARLGYIINDLRRNRLAIWLSWLLARTVIRNPIGRFDAPVSCQRAFSLAELRSMAERAGMEHFTLRKHRMFRMALAGPA